MISGKPKIPPKPVMPAEAATYPKLSKIYKELKRQNEIIFDAEKERNAWELERDDLERACGISPYKANNYKHRQEDKITKTVIP